MLWSVVSCGILLMLMAPAGVHAPAGGSTVGPIAAEAGAGQTGLVEYSPGTMPLILTIPHGGTAEPSHLPDRISGTAGRHDTNTLELGRAIAAALERRTGRSPYLVITLVHRKKVDTNRELFEAAQEDSGAIAVWEEWHAWIDSAKREVTRRFGAGLLVDLHGHRHRERWLEFGYLLSGSDLAASDERLNEGAAVSSIGVLAHTSPMPFAQILRGSMSLGALFEDRGYESVPSPTHSHPRGKPFFSGGYNTERHGSHQGGSIAAVQLETPWEGVRDTEAHRARFAEAAAEVFEQFLETHCAPHAE